MRRPPVWIFLAFAFGTYASAQSVTCSPKNGLSFEKQFCDEVKKAMRDFKPTQVASNRTLAQSSIEFSASSQDTCGIIGSVLVKDPIGKNTVKLIFPGDVSPTSAAAETIIALGKILRRSATVLNVGWIVVVPPRSARR